MFVLGNLLITIAKLLNFVIGIYIWLIIIRALLSWFSANTYSQFYRILIQLTEPALRPIRNLIPLNIGIDLSAIVALLLLYFVRGFLVATLMDLGLRLQ